MTILTDLLRMDDVARPYGSGLHPKLRAALEADLRWPSKAAVPVPSDPVDLTEMPENVVSLAERQPAAGKKSA
ncbi:MAG: hypothetical protein AAFR68_03285 [Pseudomonadota bacterium]